MKKNILRSLFNDQSDDAEDRTKFIRRRIQIVEKHVPALSSAFYEYVNKNAGLMDCGDKIASALENYSKAESVTTGIKRQLADFANVLYDIGGKRNNQIKSMESNILEELNEYGKMCKNVQTELKSLVVAYDREKNRLRQLRRAQDHSDDRHQISEAEAELAKARCDSRKSCQSLEEQIDIFERRRLSGLRDVLLSWALAELRYHAKALELFTDAYNVAARIDVESDVEEFRNKLRASNTPKLDTSREGSFQGSESFVQFLSMPFHRSGERLTGVGIPHPSPSRVPATSDSNQSGMF